MSTLYQLSPSPAHVFLFLPQLYSQGWPWGSRFCCLSLPHTGTKTHTGLPPPPFSKTGSFRCSQPGLELPAMLQPQSSSAGVIGVCSPLLPFCFGDPGISVSLRVQHPHQSTSSNTLSHCLGHPSGSLSSSSSCSVSQLCWNIKNVTASQAGAGELALVQDSLSLPCL